MSVEATAAVWAMRNLSSTEKLVAVRIADHADPQGRNAWPSVARLMADTGLSERAVQKTIRRLETLGVVTRDPAKGPRGTNLYSLNLKAKGAPRTPAPRTPVPGAPPSEVHPPPVPRTPEPPSDVHPNHHSTANGTVKVPPQPPRSTALVPVDSKPAVLGAVEQVFHAWQEATGSKRAVLDTNRRRLIAKQLKAYPVEDLVDAVRGWRRSPHHRGENRTHTIYNRLELLLRDADHVEQFRDLERGGNGTVAAPSLSKGARNLEAVMARREGA
jgi:hypothetical protein